MPATAHTNTRRRRHGERGVTVSELVLVVVVVVGLLFVATTASRGIRDETASSNCQTELRTLKLATERYHAENDTYPLDKAVLVDGGLVSADDVENWDLAPDAAGSSPAYQPSGPCG